MEQAFMLTMAVMMTLLFFVVGGIVGWIANRTFLENQPINMHPEFFDNDGNIICLLYTSPSPRDAHESRMPSSA